MKYTKVDLSGHQQGNLIVLNEYSEMRQNKSGWTSYRMLRCKCLKCGDIFPILKANFPKRTRPSCNKCEGWNQHIRINVEDFIGKQYGSLKVLGRVNKPGNCIFECQCDCGRICHVRKQHLISGKTTNCPICKGGGLVSFEPNKVITIAVYAQSRHERAKEKYIGQKNGLLTCKSFSHFTPMFNKEGKQAGRRAWFNCECDCGKTIQVVASRLEYQKTCGCKSHLSTSKAKRIVPIDDALMRIIKAKIYSDQEIAAMFNMPLEEIAKLQSSRKGIHGS